MEKTMQPSTIIEIFGYIGSALVVVSMLMSSIVKLRVINVIGSIISGVYAVICGAIPLAIMNVCLIVINGYNLVKLLKTKNIYDFVESSGNDSLVGYFLDHYSDDIVQYFPGFDRERAKDMKAYIACCNGSFAGMLIGSETDGEVDIMIDYSIPKYRDCSVGSFIYENAPACGVRSLRFSEKLTDAHRDYLSKVGFAAKDGAFVKNLG